MREEELAFHWKKAMREGDFERAWQASDQVLELRRANPRLQEGRPLWERDVWNGTPIEGKALLVRCHHGLGDTIQFVRFCERVRPRVSRLIVKAQEGLLPLFHSLTCIDELVSESAADPPYEVEAEIMELPYILRARLEDIPARVPYLHVPLAAPFSQREGIRVGLCWGVGSFLPERGIPFSHFERLLSVPALRFYSLQAGKPALDGIRFPFESGHEAPAEIAATAALLKGLDLVISIDTMVAHLAGALGIPVWTLLHHDPDWRWMRERDDSPWYPSMRLFRQSVAGDWDEVMGRVLGELQRLRATPL